MAPKIQGTIIIEGTELTVTNPDKLLWPEAGVTKAIYLQKLAALAPYLLTYTSNRLLTTIRYPHGAGGTFSIKRMPLSLYQIMYALKFTTASAM